MIDVDDGFRFIVSFHKKIKIFFDEQSIIIHGGIYWFCLHKKTIKLEK